MEQYKIEDFGTFRPTPGVNQVVQTGPNDCCTSDAAVCKDSATIATAASVTGFTYRGKDGTNIFIPISPAVSGGAAVSAAISSALQQYEINVLVNYTVSGGNFILTHTGMGTLVSVLAGGSTVNASRNCNITTVCEYCATVGATPGAVGYNGSTAALGGAPYSSAATLDTDLTAALTSLAVPFVTGSVDVTVEALTGNFKLVFKAAPGLEVTVGTKSFFAQDCKRQFA